VPLFLEVNSPLARERERYGGLSFPKTAARVERYILRRATRVLAVTHELKRILVADGAPERNVVVIPNGIDPERFRLQSTEECKARLGLAGKLVLGFTGFYRDWHRVDRVLDFMHRQRERLPHLHFWLVGDGPVRAALEAQARALELAGRVTFVGLVERDQIPLHVAAFDIALQPDVTEYASPLKLFEYMALGRAIAAPARANIREVLRDGHDALLFDPGDEESLYRVLLQLAENGDLRARLGAAARRTIDERGLTWRHNAERVLALLEEVNGRG
jgi:glycosyltransferase involved in cell wall biosynthesis